MNIYIIIPAYNEEQSISFVIRSLQSLYNYNIVVVDDGSSDNTVNIARQEGVIVLEHIINRGQGASLKTGSEYALFLGADIVIHFDADGQFDPTDIPKMVAPIIENQADIVLGSRFLNGSQTNIPFTRKFLLKGALLIDYFFSGLWLSDVHNGFRALSRLAVSQTNIRQDRMAHASEIIQEITRNKLRYTEVPVHIRYTQYSIKKGQCSLGALKILKDLFFAGLSKK